MKYFAGWVLLWAKQFLWLFITDQVNIYWSMRSGILYLQVYAIIITWMCEMEVLFTDSDIITFWFIIFNVENDAIWFLHMLLRSSGRVH